MLQVNMPTMRVIACIFISVFVFTARPQSSAATPFRNLDFESTTLLPDGAPGFESIDTALPGWRAFVGTDELSEVLFKRATLNAAAVWVWSPSPFQGDFYVTLAPGVGHPPELVGVTISQRAQIPADARYVRFLGDASYIGPQPRPPLSDMFGVYIDD